MDHGNYYDAYFEKYKRNSPCNKLEMAAILGKFSKLEDVLNAMEGRVGQPSPRHTMAYDELPTVAGHIEKPAPVVEDDWQKRADQESTYERSI